MKSTIDFCTAVERFFRDYLIKERNLSYNTIRSYRDMFVKLMDFFNKEKKIPAERVSLDDLTRQNVCDFLNWLEKSNSLNSCNQRLGAIRSFGIYMMYVEPTRMAQWKALGTIKPKKGVKGTLNYLSTEAVTCLFEQIHNDTKAGRRDLALLSLTYQAGARAQEIVDLTIGNIRWEKPYQIMVTGKGRKRRTVPISEETILLLQRYLDESVLDYQDKPSHPLFFNVWGEKLTTAGLAHILKKYFIMAAMEQPTLFPAKISPHVLRHSRAMHLLQAGVQLVYIRDILGHVSVTTTEIYARADSKQKREALENAYAVSGKSEPEKKSWQKNPKILEMLKNICK